MKVGRDTILSLLLLISGLALFELQSFEIAHAQDAVIGVVLAGVLTIWFFVTQRREKLRHFLVIAIGAFVLGLSSYLDVDQRNPTIGIGLKLIGLLALGLITLPMLDVRNPGCYKDIAARLIGR